MKLTKNITIGVPDVSNETDSLKVSSTSTGKILLEISAPKVVFDGKLLEEAIAEVQKFLSGQNISLTNVSNADNLNTSNEQYLGEFTKE